MPDMKGITVKIPADLHAELKAYAAYLPLVAACRPDWDESTVKRKTFCLISVMQQTFLRYETTSTILDIDLR